MSKVTRTYCLLKISGYTNAPDVRCSVHFTPSIKTNEEGKNPNSHIIGVQLFQILTLIGHCPGFEEEVSALIAKHCSSNENATESAA